MVNERGGGSIEPDETACSGRIKRSVSVDGAGVPRTESVKSFGQMLVLFRQAIPECALPAACGELNCMDCGEIEQCINSIEFGHRAV